MVSSDVTRGRQIGVLTLGVMAAVALPVQAQGQLSPSDEAAQRPDFFTFRAHLQTALATRDVPSVLGTVHRDIRISFGDRAGKADFQRAWGLSAPGSSRLWEELGAVLALGGSFDPQGRFVAPYVFSRWPENVDAFEHVAIVGADVRVRAAPRIGSATIASLSFAVAPLARTMSPAGRRSEWTAIRLRDGRTGYVASRFTRSPVDYRAIFERLDGRWQLVTFVAGD
jgi:hypothetical protein